MNINQINVLTLAYIGDAVYELKIREYLINKGINKVNNLQNNALNYVTAKNQCKFINVFINNKILKDEELEIVKRGRNAKVNSHPKNADILEYKWATALECLFGYLHLLNKKDRINELINIIVGDKNDSIW